MIPFGVFYILSVVGVYQSLWDSNWVEVFISVSASKPTKKKDRKRPSSKEGEPVELELDAAYASQSPTPTPVTTPVIPLDPGSRPYRCNPVHVAKIVIPKTGVAKLKSNGYHPTYDAVTANGSRTGPLRIVQLTDVHLGMFMSVDRLRAMCTTIVDRIKPDLVFLTGDYHTPASSAEVKPGQVQTGLLAEALRPLAAMAPFVFACMGNHDLESEQVEASVEADLKSLNIQLLRDKDAIAQVPGIGAVHIIGLDFGFSDQRNHIAEVFRRIGPSPTDAAHCLVLLHDPTCFEMLPPDRGCIVFSGHMHGGQMGLVSLGLSATLVGTVTRAPDHGLWKMGRNTLYVHRGQGFRSLAENFVLRVGVPNELSVITLHKD